MPNITNAESTPLFESSFVRSICGSARALSETWEWRLIVSSSDGWGM